MAFDVILEKIINEKFSKYTLSLDVGGTSTQIGIIGEKNSGYKIVYKSEVWTQKIPGVASLAKEMIIHAKENLGIKISGLGVSVAGAINPKTLSVKTTHNVKKTSLSELKKIGKKFGITKIVLLNDFEALGWGINILTNKECKTVFKGEKTLHKPILVTGAGTAFGVNILNYDKTRKIYIPHNSEGGTSDFPFNKNEDSLKKFMEKKHERVLYEDILSGKGLENLYEFVSKNKKDVFYIEKNKNKDINCKKTFTLFSKLYGRAVKNFALVSLPYSGIFICGGIAIRNPELIGADFLSEYNSKHIKQFHIKTTPINLILSKDLSLKGAAFALKYKS